MALDIDFEIATTTPVAEVASIVYDHLVESGEQREHPAVERLVDEGLQLRSGASVRVMASDPEPGSSPVSDLGFEPTVLVFSRLDPFGDEQEQMDVFVGVVVRLLARLDGDGAMTFLDDHLGMVRLDGRLVVSDDDGFWPSGRLALVTLPHERAPLGFPGAEG